MFEDNVAHNLSCQIRADDNSSACTFTTGKSVTWTATCPNEINYTQSINRLFLYKAEEGRHVRIKITVYTGCLFKINVSSDCLFKINVYIGCLFKINAYTGSLFKTNVYIGCLFKINGYTSCLFKINEYTDCLFKINAYRLFI
jgi:hypothetical protein